MTGYRPYMNRPVTDVTETGRIVRDLLRDRETPEINSNFIAFAGGKSSSTSPGSGLSSSAWTSSIGNRYVTINLGAISDDAADHIIWLVARQVGGMPYSVTPAKNDAVPGEFFWSWYKDAIGDLNVRIWNGLETLEVKAWFA